MGRLLHIVASSRGTDSNTLQVSEVFLTAFQEKYPEWIVDELNLAQEELPALSMKTVGGKYMLLQGKDLFGELKESWEEILQHIERFLAADIYLVSTPMWNFNIPYSLKHYIDLIVQPKYLFKYTESGVEGLVKNKKMIAICTRGGQYVSKDMQSYDLQEPYLRTIFGYVGISDITFIKAEPMDMGEEIRKQKIQEAQAAAKQLAEG
ncbi:MAG: NAD(P)H-dependent oxidoreductase, partial [Chlamydiota bacterium]